MTGLLKWFSKRAETPIETRDYSKVYLVLSGLLFLGTMWAVLDEVSTRRPWKDIQGEYFALSIERWKDRLKEAEVAFDSSSFLDLSAQLADADARLNSPNVREVIKEIDRLDDKLLDATRDFTFAKSRSDEAYYFWKKSIHEGSEDLGLRKKVQDLEADVARSNERVDALTRRRDSLSKAVDEYRDAAKSVSTEIRNLYASIDVAEGKIERAKNTPILIRQVMMNNFDRSNFGIPKARIDRCQTCHLGWNDEIMEDAPQPYTRHPLPDLLKIHNPEWFGCTPCHRGQGPALTAGMAHGPDDHYWEWPLLKGQEVYASCNSCHSNELHLKNGGRFNQGKMLLAESGCFACHEVKGFTDLPKIGPELNQLVAKTTSDWLFRWVRNPKDYTPHTRMPNFRFTEEEAEAITAYLWDVGETSRYRPQRGVSAAGNARRGKELVETIGCKGCHVIDDDVRMREARGASYDIAPELTRAGSKLDPDWVYEWIKNPRNYRHNARMPSLRLTDQEARDIVAYLMTLKDDRQFEQKLLALSSPEVIKRGDKLIREYGCAGCHDIKGMEKEGKVSVSLSNFGRKRADELDFGDTKVPHTWDDWVAGKLRDARQYTTERIIAKMPVFSFTEDEIAAIRTLLRGMTKEVPEPEYQRRYDKNLQAIEAGRRLAEVYNCVNCHQVEESGGAIRALLEDEGLAPPYLYPEGAKVQEMWLHDFLKSPTTIRPWLNIRMPSFQLTDAEITTLSKYFLALHKKELELRDYKSLQPDPRYVSVGKTLFDDLQCLSCHYTGKVPEGKEPSDLAPNLALAKDRLKPEWVVDWIIDPAKIQPGTRMPMYYPELDEPSPYSEALNGDVREQIKALRDYIMTLRQSK